MLFRFQPERVESLPFRFQRAFQFQSFTFNVAFGTNPFGFNPNGRARTRFVCTKCGGDDRSNPSVAVNFQVAEPTFAFGFGFAFYVFPSNGLPGFGLKCVAGFRRRNQNRSGLTDIDFARFLPSGLCEPKSKSNHAPALIPCP